MRLLVQHALVVREHKCALLREIRLVEHLLVDIESAKTRRAASETPIPAADDIALVTTPPGERPLELNDRTSCFGLLAIVRRRIPAPPRADPSGGPTARECAPSLPATDSQRRSGSAPRDLLDRGMRPCRDNVPRSTGAGRLSLRVGPRWLGTGSLTRSGSSTARVRRSGDGAGSSRYRSPAVRSHRAAEYR